MGLYLLVIFIIFHVWSASINTCTKFKKCKQIWLWKTHFSSVLSDLVIPLHSVTNILVSTVMWHKVKIHFSSRSHKYFTNLSNLNEKLTMETEGWRTWRWSMRKIRKFKASNKLEEIKSGDKSVIFCNILKALPAHVKRAVCSGFKLKEGKPLIYYKWLRKKCYFVINKYINK